MRKSPFEYRRNATRDDVRRLVADMSPLEHAPEGVLGRLVADLYRSRTYVVTIDSRLAGICFVVDLDDRREMAFTKTAYLTERRPVTFARSIPLLLADLDRHEAEAGRDRLPMHMHVPEGDVRSLSWFIRAGCTPAQDGEGLVCPRSREVSP